jgi:Fe-S-cluster-containing hydrogenase component 2
MDAITMEKNLSIIKQKRCIGCANCIITCPEKAITLQQKEEIKIPPVTLEELYEKIAEETKTNRST